MDRRSLLTGGLVTALVPVELLASEPAVSELRWTNEMPAVEGYYLRRNPAVYSCGLTYVPQYMTASGFNPIQKTTLPMEWFGPIPCPWREDDG